MPNMSCITTNGRSHILDSTSDPVQIPYVWTYIPNVHQGTVHRGIKPHIWTYTHVLYYNKWQVTYTAQCKWSCTNRICQSLNLYSMEHRRKRGDMIQAYTILHKIDRIDPSNFFTQSKYKGTRNDNMKLFKPRFESELRKHAFSQRIIELRVLSHFQG